MVDTLKYRVFHTNLIIMIKYVKYTVVFVLAVAMMWSSFNLYLFNSTSLPSDVCGDCYPLTPEEIVMYNNCTIVLSISALGILLLLYINTPLNVFFSKLYKILQELGKGAGYAIRR